MSVNLCYQNLFGFSRESDSCISTPGWDASYAISKSNLYLDELEGMELRILDAVGGKNTIWELLENARQSGIERFKSDIFKELLKYNEYRRENFIGIIGHPRFNNAVQKFTYHGMRVFSDIRGGVFTLRGITLNLNSTENVNLLIYDDYDLLHTIVVSSLANKPKYTAITPIELELNGNYYFIYSPVGIPMNNQMTCGCGGYRWCFNTERTCYNSSKDNWTLWSMAGGIHGTDIAEREDWSVSHFAQGLRLHGDFKCDAMAMLCSDSSDFEFNEIDRYIAEACMLKTAEFASYKILNSGEVSRNLLLGNDDVVNGRMQYYSSLYQERINFIAQNIEPSRNECLRCRPAMGMGKISQRL